jgi:hypothetical protein
MTDLDNTLVRSYVQVRDNVLQKGRIAFGNRISAVENGSDEMDTEIFDRLKWWYDMFEELEKRATEELIEACKGIEIIERMCAIKGISYVYAAQIYSMVDIHRADTVSALWRYAGYAVIEGKREYPVAGERMHYNKRLKTVLYNVAGSFMKARAPYSEIYYKSREYYEANREEWTKGHINNAARRKMTKLFLSHLWLVWRQIEGLPTREPYVHEKLGHTTYYPPEDFGWNPV